MYELSKKGKKRAREIFSLSIEKEFETALQNSEEIIVKRKNDIATSRELFHETRTYLNNFLKHLELRYDDLRSHDYLITLSEILKEGYITEKELQDFSDEAKEDIKRYDSLSDDNHP